MRNGVNDVGVSEDLAAIRAAELDYCREHPRYFIETHCRIESKDSASGVIPFALWSAQAEALESIRTHKLNIILKARQLGLTWLVLCYALHLMLSKTRCTVIAISKTEEDSKELVRRVNMLISNMTALLADNRITSTSMSVSIDDSVFRAFPAAQNAGRSFTADLIILDEWAFQAWAEEIWQAGFPTINRPGGGQLIGLSTMRQSTLFSDMWLHGDGFNRIFIPWDADPTRDSAWYDAAHKALGEAVYAEYPSTPEEAFLSPRGAFFDEFRREIHTCEPFEIPSDWRRYHAIDYGLDGLASIWAAIDGDGDIWVYQECGGAGVIIADAVKMIRSYEDAEPYIRLAPPDQWGRTRETGETQAQIWYRHGLRFEKSSNNREAGWATLKDWLRPITRDGEETARLKIFKHCTELISTLQAIPRDKRKPNDCAVEPHNLTHFPDALRYLVVMCPKPRPEAPEKPVYHFKSEEPPKDLTGRGERIKPI